MRRLRAGGDTLRDGDASPLLFGAEPCPAYPPDRARAPGAAAANRARHSRGPRDDRAQGPRQGPRRSVRERRRDGRRIAAVCGEPADPIAADPGLPAVLALVQTEPRTGRGRHDGGGRDHRAGHRLDRRRQDLQRPGPGAQGRAAADSKRRAKSTPRAGEFARDRRRRAPALRARGPTVRQPRPPRARCPDPGGRSRGPPPIARDSQPCDRRVWGWSTCASGSNAMSATYVRYASMPPSSGMHSASPRATWSCARLDDGHELLRLSIPDHGDYFDLLRGRLQPGRRPACNLGSASLRDDGHCDADLASGTPRAARRTGE